MLCLIIEGGTSKALTAKKATKLLAQVEIHDAITFERVATATDFVTEITMLDQALRDTRKRTVASGRSGSGRCATSTTGGRLGSRLPTSTH